MNIFPKILATTALCLAAVGLNSCSFSSVEERGPVLAFSYHQNGGVDKAYYFPENTPYPRELSEWIEYNNGKLYHATMVTYAPGGISLHFPAQKLHFSFHADIIHDGSNYRNLTQQDKAFLDWLKSLPRMSNQVSDELPSAQYGELRHCRQNIFEKGLNLFEQIIKATRQLSYEPIVLNS